MSEKEVDFSEEEELEAAIEEEEDYEKVAFPASIELDEDEVPPTDITFECPTCGKSLSIDHRGAGLTITCTQCGNAVSVPIPEGMEIDDFDASPEELSMQLVRTRQNLSRAQSLLADANAELLELRQFKEAAESAQRERRAKFEHAQLKLSDVIRLNSEIGEILREIASKLFDSEEKR